ncbi:MAG: cyclase [Deltaproteobacteria bacterium]|nr:cyclase [Deltaproteobacteria bacterium]
MAYLLIDHQVADFDKWKPVYDEHENARRKAGLKELFLLRGRDNPKQVLILFEASDLAKTQEFINSQDLRERMQKAGVIGKPNFQILEKAAAFRKAA